MSTILYQYKQAWAGLKKTPGFILSVVISMGLTLGALLCVLTLANVLLNDPLPYPEQESLYKVDQSLINDSGEEWAKAYNYPGLMHLYKKQQAFSEIGLLYYDYNIVSSLATQPNVNTTFVTPGWADLFQGELVMGRHFSDSEEVNTHNPVAILSYQMWQQEFQGADDVLSKSLIINDVSFRIVGVLAQSFVEPEIYNVGYKTQVWLPWDFNPTPERAFQAWNRVQEPMLVVGKLKPGLVASQVEQSLTTMMDDTWQQAVVGDEYFNGWRIDMSVQSLKSTILGDTERTILLLIAGVVGLLLIAIANISNLFMARTVQKQRDLAICASVGAKKSHLFNMLFAESSLLLSMALLLALLVAHTGFDIMQSFLSDVLPRVHELSINGFTLVSAVILTLLCALGFTALSNNMLNYKALNLVLRSSGKGTSFQVAKSIRQLLIVSQVAIASCLVFANFNLIEQAYSVISAPYGFTMENRVYVSVMTTGTKADSEEKSVVMSQFAEQLEQLPQVRGVSRSVSPLRNMGSRAITMEGSKQKITPELKYIDDKYLSMVEQPLLYGNTFSREDILDNTPVVLVNASFAERVSTDLQQVVGQTLSFGDDTVYTVIGVVADTIMPGTTEPKVQLFKHTSIRGGSFLIELAPDYELDREQAAQILRGISSQYSLFEMKPLMQTRMRMLFSQFTMAITSASLALVTFLLASIGLYGILSYTTQLRRFELGTRMALGAKRFAIVGLVIGENTMTVVLGFIASVIILFSLYIGFSAELNAYIGEQLILISVITLSLITWICLFACYWPVRAYINRPVINTLRE
ncbi:ABC transporter permease [Thalassomonas actiniarum]|uniref:ABC transporter permease n=1 Tax=Thalassomonas actiniarum TaxID=485447 RepID=A0AAE9YVP1_9GAMM|nr:ABC transporter permease [Thalassomonas actiniarum]WDE02125.1 ABC transporter permease [Thalassomonas actiniarum]